MYIASKLGQDAPARTLRLICQVCGGEGWVQAAPVEESDGLDHRYVRASYVGSFHPIPCFVCSGYQVFKKAS